MDYLMNFMPLIIIALLIAIVMITSIWKVFVKAGEPGWAAMVPIYNLYIMLKIGGKPGWWILLFLIPVVNYVFFVWTCNMISKSFGKDEGFTVGLILLGIIFWPILGFGNAQYQGPFGNPEAYQDYQQQHHKFDFEKEGLK